MYPTGTAAAAGLVSCRICNTLQSEVGSAHCCLCHAALSARIPQSAQRSLACLLTAGIFYIPAMVLPIMETMQLGRATQSTIIGGVVNLWSHGSYPIASVIFIASVVVPILKMIALGWLNWFVLSGRSMDHQQANRMYALTELIGKWSMVDVFVVALLVALIQLGSLMSIKPGPAAIFFAGLVVFTMIAANLFDKRLIWDREASDE